MLTDKKTGSFQMAIQGIFFSWEKLRVLFNAVLVIESLVLIRGIDDFWMDITPAQFMRNAVFYSFMANLFYMVGPFVESYATWVGSQFRWLRSALFVTGTTFSTGVVYFVLQTVEHNMH